MLNSTEIKPVAIAIIEYTCLKALVSQSVSRKNLPQIGGRV